MTRTIFYFDREAYEDALTRVCGFYVPVLPGRPAWGVELAKWGAN